MEPDKSGSRVSADVNPPLDDQQSRLLSILSGRAGEPVTYSELRDAGIEFPAGLIAELELAGVEVDRCRVAVPGGRPVRAVRLPSPVEGHRPAVEQVVEPPRSSEPPSRRPVRPEPFTGLARGSEPTLSASPRPQPISSAASRPQATSSPSSSPQAPATAAPHPQPGPRDLPEPKPLTTGSPASGGDWTPVRVYRRSLRDALAARRAKRARRRDAEDIIV